MGSFLERLRESPLGRLAGIILRGFFAFALRFMIEVIFCYRYWFTLYIPLIAAFPVWIITDNVLGSSFVPFGICAVCVPLAYGIHYGILALVNLAGYRIVDVQEERRISAEYIRAVSQRYSAMVENHTNQSAAFQLNPILHPYRNLNRSNNGEFVQSVPNVRLDHNLTNNVAMR